MKTLILTLLLTLPTLASEIALWPYGYERKAGIVYLTVNSYADIDIYKYALSLKYENRNELSKYSAWLKRSFERVFFKLNARTDESRDEYVVAAEYGLHAKNYLRITSGYNYSVTDRVYHMAALKLDFKLLKYLVYSYHMRSDFDARMYEWWQQLGYKVDLSEAFSFKLRVQLDNQDGYTDQELEVFLIYNFKEE